MSGPVAWDRVSELGAWVVDTQRPDRIGIVECSTVRKVWVVFDPTVWPPEKRWRDQLRQMSDEEIDAWSARAAGIEVRTIAAGGDEGGVDG